MDHAYRLLRRTLLVHAAAAALVVVGVVYAFAKPPRVFIYSGLGDFAGMAVAKLAQDLHKKCGAEVTVTNHLAASATVEQVKHALAAHRFVALLGHSMGGNAARNVAVAVAPYRVDALVTLDPNRFIGGVPNNVRYALNLYQRVGLGGGKPVGARQVEITGVGHLGFARSNVVLRRAEQVVCRR